MPSVDYFKNVDDTITLDAGSVIFDQGDEGEIMYAIREGEIEIQFNGNILATLTPGEIFGEMALIDTTIRSAKAIAKTDCMLVPIDKQRFLFLVHETPTFALQVMRTMTDRMRAMHRMI